MDLPYRVGIHLKYTRISIAALSIHNNFLSSCTCFLKCFKHISIITSQTFSSSSRSRSDMPNSASTRCHPLQLLNDAEIRQASSILVCQVHEQNNGSGEQRKIHFKNVSLHDPPKALLLPHLDAEAAGVSSGVSKTDVRLRRALSA